MQWLEEMLGEEGGREQKMMELQLGPIEKREEEANKKKISALLKTPKKSVKLIDKTMKGWNRERSTLPEDLHYSGHELVSSISYSQKGHCSSDLYIIQV